MFAFSETVTRLRAAQRVDSHGLPVAQRDWDNADPLTISGVHVQPLSSRESRGSDVRMVTSEWILISRPRGGDLDIIRADRIQWGVHTFEIIGDPERWPALAGGIDHVEITLQMSPPYAGAGGDSADGQTQAAESGAAASYGWRPQ